MYKKLFLSILLSLSVGVYAADKVSRAGQGITLNQGGTSTTTGKTVVESDSPTNAFRIIIVTAAVTGAQTASTNTLTTTFISTPTAIKGEINTLGAQQITNLWSVGTTVSTTSLIVTGMSTNADTGVNNLPVIIYGPARTGTFQ